MTIKSNTAIKSSMLLNALTDIWQDNGISRDSIISLINEFTNQDWLLLVGLDFVSSWGPSSGKFVFTENKISIQSNDGITNRIITMIVDNDIAASDLISYTRFDKCFRVEGLVDKVNNIDRDAVALVELLSYLYFHVDSIVMLPPELRHERLSSISSKFNLPANYLLNLINWLSKIY